MITGDKSCQLLAYHYIGAQLKKLCHQLEGVRQSKDIEFIHQSRVASRRIRAAMGIFETCFGIKQVKRWRKEIKKLTKGLGLARDCDVQIEFLKKELLKLKKKDSSLHPGIERVLLRTQQNRQKLQDNVIKTIDELKSKDVFSDIYSALEKINFYLLKQNSGVKSEYVFKITSEHITSRLQQLLSYQDCLKEPGDKLGHHKMRIASKRLRYTMEICQEPYNSRLDDEVNAAKKLQTILGEIHDYDVWIENISELTEQEFHRTKEYFGYDKPFYPLLPGLEYLQKQLGQKRQNSFEDLLVYWNKITEKKIWEKLTVKLNRAAKPRLTSQFQK